LPPSWPIRDRPSAPPQVSESHPTRYTPGYKDGPAKRAVRPGPSSCSSCARLYRRWIPGLSSPSRLTAGWSTLRRCPSRQLALPVAHVSAEAVGRSDARLAVCGILALVPGTRARSFHHGMRAPQTPALAQQGLELSAGASGTRPRPRPRSWNTRKKRAQSTPDEGWRQLPSTSSAGMSTSCATRTRKNTSKSLPIGTGLVKAIPAPPEEIVGGGCMERDP
jgi:hypothetical protein